MGAGRSLRVRLLAAAACSLVVALALAGIGLTLLFEQHVERRLEAELGTHLDQLTAALAVTSSAPEVTGPLSDPRFLRPYGGLYWQVEGPAGGAIPSRSLWDFSLGLPPDPLDPSELHRYRLVGPAGRELLALERQVRIAEGAFRLVVAVDRREIRRVVLQFGQSMALSLGVLAVFLLAAAAAQVSVGLRPLARLRAELARMRTGQAPDPGAGSRARSNPWSRI